MRLVPGTKTLKIFSANCAALAKITIVTLNNVVCDISSISHIHMCQCEFFTFYFFAEVNKISQKQILSNEQNLLK